ncbi:hypothetical protein VPBB_1663 [Vibrio parahaemolyticus BB22OP]|nr:hypothetical protein VPBB_1663 [Vibrio parahaemolyticus BB22OP]
MIFPQITENTAVLQSKFITTGRKVKNHAIITLEQVIFYKAIQNSV